MKEHHDSSITYYSVLPDRLFNYTMAVCRRFSQTSVVFQHSKTDPLFWNRPISFMYGVSIAPCRHAVVHDCTDERQHPPFFAASWVRQRPASAFAKVHISPAREQRVYSPFFLGLSKIWFQSGPEWSYRCMHRTRTIEAPTLDAEHM
jgi:hypothetical protein